MAGTARSDAHLMRSSADSFPDRYRNCPISGVNRTASGVVVVIAPSPPSQAHTVPPVPEPVPPTPPEPPPVPDLPPPQIDDPPAPDDPGPVREPIVPPPAVAALTPE